MKVESVYTNVLSSFRRSLSNSSKEISNRILCFFTYNNIHICYAYIFAANAFEISNNIVLDKRKLRCKQKISSGKPGATTHVCTANKSICKERKFQTKI